MLQSWQCTTYAGVVGNECRVLLVKWYIEIGTDKDTFGLKIGQIGNAEFGVRCEGAEVLRATRELTHSRQHVSGIDTRAAVFSLQFSVFDLKKIESRQNNHIQDDLLKVRYSVSRPQIRIILFNAPSNELIASNNHGYKC